MRNEVESRRMPGLRKIFLILILAGMGSGLLLAIDQGGKDNNDEKPQKEDLDEDLDELDKELKPEPVEENVSILEIMKEIEERMFDAAEGLSRASIWKAIKEQEAAELKLEEIIKKQKEALEQLNNLFKHTKVNQEKAIGEINKLIKLAREMQMQLSQSQAQPQKQQQQQKPQKTQTQQMQTAPRKPKGPAERPYEATGSLPPDATTRTGDTTKSWGNLPPKLREAINQTKKEEFLLEYKERLKRYFKILAEEE